MSVMNVPLMRYSWVSPEPSFEITAAPKKWLGGRAVRPRQGGALFYLMNGMIREATEGPTGWRAPGVMERAYNQTGSGEIAPWAARAQSWTSKTSKET